MGEACFNGLFDRLFIHPCHHQYTAILGILRNGRNQPVGIEFDLADQAHVASLASTLLAAAMVS